MRKKAKGEKEKGRKVPRVAEVVEGEATQELQDGWAVAPLKSLLCSAIL